MNSGFMRARLIFPMYVLGSQRKSAVVNSGGLFDYNIYLFSNAHIKRFVDIQFEIKDHRDIKA